MSYNVPCPLGNAVENKKSLFEWWIENGFSKRVWKCDQEERAEPIEQFAVEIKNNVSFKENGQ